MQIGWLILLYCSLAALLLGVAIEDFRYRAVSWWIFPLLALVNTGMEFKQIEPGSILLNTCFTLLNLAMLTLYVGLKEKKIVNITLSYLGWGDILFWLAACLLFSPINFICFFIASLFITMIVSLVFKSYFLKQEFKTIPLAGMQSVTLLILLIIKISTIGFSFRNDDWIATILIG
jgi:hypothetical protein